METEDSAERQGAECIERSPQDLRMNWEISSFD